MHDKKDMLDELNTQVGAGKGLLISLLDIFSISANRENMLAGATGEDIQFLEQCMNTEQCVSVQYLKEQVAGSGLDLKFIQDLIGCSKTIERLKFELNTRILKSAGLKTQALEVIRRAIEDLRYKYPEFQSRSIQTSLVFEQLSGVLVPDELELDTVKKKVLERLSDGDIRKSALIMNARNGRFTPANGVLFCVRDVIEYLYPQASKLFRIRLGWESEDSLKCRMLVEVDKVKVGAMEFDDISTAPKIDEIKSQFDAATLVCRDKLGINSWDELDGRYLTGIDKYGVKVATLHGDIQGFLEKRASANYVKGHLGFADGSLERFDDMNDEEVYEWVARLTSLSIGSDIRWSYNDSNRLLKLKAFVVLGLLDQGRIKPIRVIKRVNHKLIKAVEPVEFSDVSEAAFNRFPTELVNKIKSDGIKGTAELAQAVLLNKGEYLSPTKGAFEMIDEVSPELVFTTLINGRIPQELMGCDSLLNGVRSWTINLDFLNRVCPNFYDLIEFELAGKSIYLPALSAPVIKWFKSQSDLPVVNAVCGEMFREELNAQLGQLDLLELLNGVGCDIFSIGLTAYGCQNVWNNHIEKRG